MLVVMTIAAQDNLIIENKVNSPYSMYMTGDITPGQFAPGRAMGGTSVGLRIPNRINIINPASYTAQDTLSFIFDMGFEGDYINLSNETETQGTQNFNISHISAGFKANKYWAGGVGLMPYSKTGYNIILNPTINEVSLKSIKKGVGDLNRLYAGSAFNLIPSLSIGINFSYIFGDLSKSLHTYFPEFDSVSQDYYKTEKIFTNGFMWDFGIQYTYQKEKNKITVGAIYQPETELQAENHINHYYLLPNYTSVILQSDTINVKTTIPSKIGFGISYTLDDRFTFAFDYKTQDWSNSVIFGNKDSVSVSNDFNFGLQIIPNTKTKDFLKRLNYRAGGFYQTTPIKIGDEHIKNYGVTMGLGIPYKNTNTMFNIACEIGKRGNLTGNIIQENYIKVIFDISFFDYWFYKPKID